MKPRHSLARALKSQLHSYCGLFLSRSPLKLCCMADRRTGAPADRRQGGGGGSLLNSSPGLKESGKSKCVANHVDVQRCYSSVFHRMPPLLRLGLDRAHAPTSTWSALTVLGFYIVKRLGMSALNIGVKRAALRTTRVFDSSNDVHFIPPHF